MFNIFAGASNFVLNQAGTTMLSQLSQVITLDHRDSRLYPHEGFVVELGNDFAGLGGDVRFIRTNVNGAYYIPLEQYFGDPEWGIKLAASTGYLAFLGGRELIIDRFFLGGDNLRGFQTGGAGPHDARTRDPLGGRFIWTQTTELRFPMPVSPDLGLSGRAFIDIGSLSLASFRNNSACPTCIIEQSAAPRIGAGVGLSWKTAFGLINIDLAPFVVKQPRDQTQIFRFGFGTRF